MSDVGDFYDLAMKRKVEIDRLRVELAEKDWENKGLRIQLAERTATCWKRTGRSKRSMTSLDYCRQECDDLEKQLDAVVVSRVRCVGRSREPCETPLQYPMPKPHTLRFGPQSSSPVALPVPAGDDNPDLRDVQSPRRASPPHLQQRGTPMTWPVHDG